MDEPEVLARLRSAGDAHSGPLDPLPIRRRGRALRRRRHAVTALSLVLLVAAAGIAGAAIGRQSRRTIVIAMAPPAAAPDGASTMQGLSGHDENQAIIDSLPVVDGARFSAYSQQEGPSGRGSLISYVTYRAADDSFDAGSALDAFRSLPGWTVAKDQQLVTRRTVSLTRGRSLVSVTAYPARPGAPPILSILVAGVDGQVLLKAMR